MQVSEACVEKSGILRLVTLTAKLPFTDTDLSFECIASLVKRFRRCITLTVYQAPVNSAKPVVFRLTASTSRYSVHAFSSLCPFNQQSVRGESDECDTQPDHKAFATVIESQGTKNLLG